MMSTKRHEKIQAVDTRSNDNDLSQIHGIGPARRQWLKDRLHIETIADLAEASADEIYTRLKEEQIVARSKIESWIEQAQAILASGSHQAKSVVHEQGWKPFASFVIEFQKDTTTGNLQTRAHYIEADRTVNWPRIEHEVVSQWMMEQLGQKPQEVIQPAIIPPVFSTRLESLLAKVGQMPPARQPEPAANAALPLQQGQLPSRLREIIAKAQRLAATTPTASSSASLQGSMKAPEQKDFSDQMKQILARAEKMTTKR